MKMVMDDPEIGDANSKLEMLTLNRRCSLSFKEPLMLDLRQPNKMELCWFGVKVSVALRI